jgi:hypothetical protein
MVALAVGVVALAAWIRSSRFGRRSRRSARTSTRAEALGVDSTKYKLLVHALSAALVAVAGSLFAINFQYISPGHVFDFRLSLTIVLMPIVAASALWRARSSGALLFGYLQIKLRRVRAARLLSLHLRRDADRRHALRAEGTARLLRRLRRRSSAPLRSRCPMPAEALLEVRGSPSVTRVSSRSAGVDFEVSRGEIFGVIGPTAPARRRSSRVSSGRAADRGDDPLPGRIGSTAFPITGSSRAASCARTRSCAPFRDMTVRENVQIGAHFGSGRRRGEEAGRANGRDPGKDVALPSRRGARGHADDRRAQRLEIARALATEPESSAWTRSWAA